MIYTGGTIGMGPKTKGDPTSPLVPKPFNELLEFLPGLDEEPDGNGFRVDEGRGIHVEYDDTVFDEPLDSSNVGPRHWVKIARVIEKHYADFDGFVILHGTDTMSYTGSGLAFILENLTKPVVLTGSQLPISHVRTDGRNNVINAILIAGWRATFLPRIPEVVLCFGEKILRAVRTTKVSASGFHGFDSPNCQPLGTIGMDIVINEDFIPKEADLPKSPLKVHDIEKRVLNKGMRIRRIGVDPGLDEEWLNTLLEAKHLRGLILETFGTGNAPTNPEICEAFRTGIFREKAEDRWPWVVVNITDCPEGAVELGLYDGSSAFLESGVVSGSDMTREAAFAKIHWALASQPEIRLLRSLQISQRGEQSLNIFDFRYKGGSSITPDSPYSDTQTTPRELSSRAFVEQAVVRLRNITCNKNVGDTVRLHILVNEPDPRNECIGDPSVLQSILEVDWQGKPTFVCVDVTELFRKHQIPTDVTLSIVVEDNTIIDFDSLYLAIATRAHNAVYHS
ncbi:asparaginase [bacterium]|nr:asparaginase [bacterium]MBU1636320.1 asparaginase [bacterium]MBU1920018.1 asparaginase [bacterium]